ncbi:hypothetical protein CAI21_22120 [Alkalilimnicola ehrlichii]|uniref:Phage tail collar domain-containing protein n=1 Tax=Alkalilimnicola ehrlichii TaxID=351052 RepID=A0A3E0WQ94_9GAMM|nr:tail fiber protein [Alkalilimnicola ehrlichii]RFA24323.1 hypothetical protein CAI21_22120 [Alkalilimnicola ehrlichii]RFA35124.1 hypothetical protein CAL65_13540 [Alkalilimnicola ehrlichii]
MSRNYARYVNVLRDSKGAAVESADVYVYVGDSTTLAQLYDGAGNTVGQPLRTDADGLIDNGSTTGNPLDRIGFKARGGRYRVRVVKNGDTFQLPDLLLGNAQGYDVADLLPITADTVYESTDEGLAATGDGDYFWVATGGDDILELYRNDGGNAEYMGGLSSGADVREQAVRAEEAADQAEEYRDQIAVFGGYFADAAAGIAGTSDGDIFSVANDPDPGKITIYRNDDGRTEVVQTYYMATGDAATKDTESSGGTVLESQNIGSAARHNVGNGPNDIPTNSTLALTIGIPGTVSEWVGDELPFGALWCDGSTVSRTEYARLYGIIGTKFGDGDGETTFNVPDRRNRVAVGAGDQYEVGEKGGRDQQNHSHPDNLSVSGHPLSVGQLPGHDHHSGVSLPSNTSDGVYNAYAEFGHSGNSSSSQRATGSTSGGTYWRAVTGLRGTGSPHLHGLTGGVQDSDVDVRQPYEATNFIIWY